MIEIKVNLSINIYGIITVNLNLVGAERIDVHTFDKQYNHNIKTKYTKEIKIEKFIKLMNEINDFKFTEPIHGLQKVISDIETEANFDRTSDLKADDVLIEIVNLLENTDKDTKSCVFLNLLEQMNDMLTSGPCPQGRTNRLMQIYKFLEN